MWAQSGVVIGFALVWGIAELSLTFQRETIIDLLSKGPSWALIVVNIAVAFALLMMAKLSLERLGRPSDNIYVAAAIGFSYPALLRSQLAHVGKIGIAEGLNLSAFTLSLSGPYSRVQQRFKIRLDSIFSARGTARAKDLQNRFTAQVLYETISTMCEHLQVEEHKTEKKKYLKKLSSITDHDKKHSMLATMLVTDFERASYEEALTEVAKRHSPKQETPRQETPKQETPKQETPVASTG